MIDFRFNLTQPATLIWIALLGLAVGAVSLAAPATLTDILTLAYNRAIEGGGDVRFGAVVVDSFGSIVASGRNRRSNLADRSYYRDLRSHLETTLQQEISPKLWIPDYATHAEMDAIFQATAPLKQDSLVVLSLKSVFVLGVRKDGLVRVIQKKPSFVCATCSAWMKVLNLPVHVFTEFGWQQMTPDEAVATSKTHATSGFWDSQFGANTASEKRSPTIQVAWLSLPETIRILTDTNHCGQKLSP